MRRQKERKKSKDRRSQNSRRQNKVSTFSSPPQFFTSPSPSHPPPPLLLLWSQIRYSSQQSPSNNLPEVPATWKSITVIRGANRNGGPGLHVCFYYYVCKNGRGWSFLPGVAQGGKRGRGGGGCRIHQDGDGIEKVNVIGTEQWQQAWRGVDGWARCREEVICQIGFHSQLRLTAACHPGRLTVSDSLPCVGTHEKYAETHPLAHGWGQKLTMNNVSVGLLGLLFPERKKSCAPIKCPAIIYHVV